MIVRKALDEDIPEIVTLADFLANSTNTGAFLNIL